MGIHGYSQEQNFMSQCDGFFTMAIHGFAFLGSFQCVTSQDGFRMHLFGFFPRRLFSGFEPGRRVVHVTRTSSYFILVHWCKRKNWSKSPSNLAMFEHSEHKHTQNSLLMSIHFRVLRGPSGPSGSFGSSPPLTSSLCLCPWASPCHGLAITAKGTWALKQTWQWEIPHKWAFKWDYCLGEIFNCHICLPPKGTSFYPTDPRTGSTWCLRDQHEQFKSVTFQTLPSSRTPGSNKAEARLPFASFPLPLPLISLDLLASSTSRLLTFLCI